MTAVFVLAVLAVVLVNGWTDAPDAIAGCIATRSMSPRGALLLAGVCNFTGAVGMTCLSTGVAETLYGIADFGAQGTGALISLTAGILAVILWAVAAWRFGIPTSEGHALIAGITGAALGQRMSLEAIRAEEWRSVLFGLILTTLPPLLLSSLLSNAVGWLLRHADRRRAVNLFVWAQRLGAAGSAFMHGAQDSQKLLGVLLLGLSLSGMELSVDGSIPLWATVTVACVMTLGTVLGGTRIIRRVGCGLTDLDAVGGSIADLSSSLSLLLCSALGAPASTTHAKTSAIMGVGLRRGGRLDLRASGEIVLAWVLTFPGCGIIGYIMAKLFMALF